jgi:Na+/glutamate symporter
VGRTIISVIGALGGVALGSFLSSRQTLKQEEMRLKQEKVKRNTQIIEEVYQTLIKIEDLCVAFAYDVILFQECDDMLK